MDLAVAHVIAAVVAILFVLFMICICKCLKHQDAGTAQQVKCSDTCAFARLDWLIDSVLVFTLAVFVK